MEKLRNSICFLCNGPKTELYFRVSKGLIKSGHRVYFITTNRYWYNWLIRNSVKESTIFLFRNKSNVTSKIYDLKVEEIIRQDRVLRYNKNSESIIQQFLNNAEIFLRKNDINFLTGEVTWAHEIALMRLSRLENKIKFIYPARVRIPDNRFIFLDDEYQSNILVRKNPFINDKSITVKPPDYILKSISNTNREQSIFGLFQKFKNLIYNPYYDKLDIMHLPNRWQRINYTLKYYVNRWMFRLLNTEENLSAYLNQKHVLFPMHKQLESSIDVLGRYYNDQLEIIKVICGILPLNYKILIKPHELALGDHSLSFYTRIKKYSNKCVIISPKLKSKDLLENQNLIAIFTVSGTIAMEASAKKIMSFCFNNVFFKNKYIKKIDYEGLRNINSFQELMKPNVGLDEFEIKQKKIIENSYFGSISDPSFNPDVLDPENIKNLIAAFLEVLDR